MKTIFKKSILVWVFSVALIAGIIGVSYAAIGASANKNLKNSAAVSGSTTATTINPDIVPFGNATTETIIAPVSGPSGNTTATQPAETDNDANVEPTDKQETPDAIEEPEKKETPEAVEAPEKKEAKEKVEAPEKKEAPETVEAPESTD